MPTSKRDVGAKIDAMRASRRDTRRFSAFHIPGYRDQHLRGLRLEDEEPPHGTRSQMKSIASIEEPQLIAKILSHLKCVAAEHSQSELPLVARGPSAQSSLP